MDIEDVIDQLAFGSTAPKISSCLGLYLSPDTIYMAETHLEGGRLAVDHLVRIPVPDAGVKVAGAPAAATLNTDFLADNTKIGALIRQSMSQIRWNSKNVMVTLSHHLGILRYFTMPAMQRRFWKTAIPLEAKKYIPIPFDILSHDYQVIPVSPDASNKPRQGTLIAVTQKKNLANITSLLQSLDMNLVGLEVAPASVLRLWETLDKASQGKTYCQVHFDGGNIRILITEKGLPVFFRELFLGAEASIGDQRKMDLSGCVSYAQKQLGVGKLSQLRVSGNAAAMAALQEAFSSELGLKASLQDTAGMLGIKGGDWGGYAAIGGSARFLDRSTIMLDLGRIGKVSDEERQTAKDIFIIAGLFALWFAVLGLYRTSFYEYKARELIQFKRPPEIEGIFTGKVPAQIDLMLSGMKDQVNTTDALVGGQSVAVTPILKDIANSLPEKVWITQIALLNPLIKTASAGGQLNLVGRAVAPTLAQEQELAFLYRDKLIKSPVLGKLFPDIQVSVTGKPLLLNQAQGLEPGALAQMLEKRTVFSITARSRTGQ